MVMRSGTGKCWKSGVFLSRMGSLNSVSVVGSNIIPVESGRAPADFKIRVRRIFLMMKGMFGIDFVGSRNYVTTSGLEKICTTFPTALLWASIVRAVGHSRQVKPKIPKLLDFWCLSINEIG